MFSESNITASPSRPSSIADDDDAAPVVLEEVFEEEVGELAERAERARQRGVGDLVVEVRVGGDPRDERNVEERRHFGHRPTRCMHRHNTARDYTVPQTNPGTREMFKQHNITYSFIANGQTAVVHKNKTKRMSKIYKSQYI